MIRFDDSTASVRAYCFELCMVFWLCAATIVSRGLDSKSVGEYYVLACIR